MAVALLILSVTLFIPFLIYSRIIYEKWKSNRVLKNGLEADGLLLSVKETGVYRNQMPQVKLQIQVYPKTGRNFVIETYELLTVPELNRLQIGGFVQIKYNPSNYKEVKLLVSNNKVIVGRFH